MRFVAFNDEFSKFYVGDPVQIAQKVLVWVKDFYKRYMGANLNTDDAAEFGFSGINSWSAMRIIETFCSDGCPSVAITREGPLGVHLSYVDESPILTGAEESSTRPYIDTTSHPDGTIITLTEDLREMLLRS